MLNFVWGIMVLVSVVCGILTGKIDAVSNAILSGSAQAIEFLISILGMMSLWTGFMKIADESGLTKKLAVLFSPVMRRLFPDYKKDSPAIKAICMNVTANILGLGNAATPFGIAAMKEMNKTNIDKTTANNSMIMFVVINTASVQLIPTTVSILRQKYGAVCPFDIMPCVWITSFFTLMIGILVAKILEKRSKNVGKA